MKLKQISVVALSVLSIGAAHATTTALGPATVGTPLAFGGFAPPGSFLDFFTFTLPPNGGSGYSVSNFTLIPVQYNTVFTNFNLVSNADGIIGTGDDTVVASATSAGAGTMNLTFAGNSGGNYYLSVIGLTGQLGGVYNACHQRHCSTDPRAHHLRHDAGRPGCRRFPGSASPGRQGLKRVLPTHNGWQMPPLADWAAQGAAFFHSGAGDTLPARHRRHTHRQWLDLLPIPRSPPR